MISVLLSIAVLVIGYVFYGRAAEKIFGPDDRQTPAYRLEDGVDFVPMKTWKAWGPVSPTPWGRSSPWPCSSYTWF